VDFQSKINNIITKVNKFTGKRDEHVLLVKEVCELFDYSLSEKVFSKQTLSLLYYLSNLIGVPQYFDLFCKLNRISSFDFFSNINLLGSLVKESSLFINKDTKVHIFQKELIELFNSNKLNRYIISAPTSFGKTFIIYHLIEKMRYKNIVLIFPTISLLTENLKRIIDLKKNGHLELYKVITLSEEKPVETGNILVFTPERFMTFLDKNNSFRYDFMFFDEIYKIDNDFIVENDGEEKKENSRDIAFRISLEIGLIKTKDALLAGPFLNYETSDTMKNFIKDNRFTSLNYNSIELVNKKKVSYNDLKRNEFDGLNFSDIKTRNKTEKIVNILKKVARDETIIYCQGKMLAEDYALKVSKENLYSVEKNDRFDKLISHLEQNYTRDWCLVKTLKKGIGIHHGTIPKYIQKEIIELFNFGIIKCIFSTTTITEGVNTTAKNMIIISHKKGKKDLKKFDVLNIMGRAGRFSKHFSGRVFILDEKLDIIIDSDDDKISHKNYGLDTDKKDIDLEITKEEYLSKTDIDKKITINNNYDANNVPENIRKSFLTISPNEKVELYKIISSVVERWPDYIPNFIKSINSRGVKLDQIQILMELIKRSIDENDRIYQYMNKGEREHSVITYMLNSYLIGGFESMLIYELDKGTTIDTSVRKVSNIVYNIFRYELVKHISIIDLIYKTIVSMKKGIKIEEVQGLGTLLSYLEYGAYTEQGRKASDLGAPANVIKHIEGSKKKLDDYETLVYEELRPLLE
jgi:hypothetical protein